MNIFCEICVRKRWLRRRTGEFFFVLEGSIEVHYGTEKNILNQGDSIYYDSISARHILPNTRYPVTSSSWMLFQ